MLRLLATRRWLVWLTVALLASVTCLFLGRWQWHRWESRHAAQTTVSDNYEATPAALTEVLPRDTSPVTRSVEWRRVTMTGTYDTKHQTLARNRPLDGSYGYQVLVPFRLTDGSAVLVDRGWVPNGPSADTPPPIPKPPAGRVTVTGWIRPAEADLGRSRVEGQVSSIRPGLVEAQGGPQLRSRGYVRMGEEDPPPAKRPQQLGKPDMGMAAGVNLSYAIQWWLGMIAFPVLVLFAARRELGSDRPKQPKPKKVRIWDEEDA